MTPRRAQRGASAGDHRRAGNRLGPRCWQECRHHRPGACATMGTGTFLSRPPRSRPRSGVRNLWTAAVASSRSHSISGDAKLAFVGSRQRGIRLTKTRGKVPVPVHPSSACVWCAGPGARCAAEVEQGASLDPRSSRRPRRLSRQENYLPAIRTPTRVNREELYIVSNSAMECAKQ